MNQITTRIEGFIRQAEVIVALCFLITPARAERIYLHSPAKWEQRVLDPLFRIQSEYNNDYNGSDHYDAFKMPDVLVAETHLKRGTTQYIVKVKTKSLGGMHGDGFIVWEQHRTKWLEICNDLMGLDYITILPARHYGYASFRPSEGAYDLDYDKDGYVCTKNCPRDMQMR